MIIAVRFDYENLYLRLMYKGRYLLFIILSILLLPVLHAQDITGDWYGKTLTSDSARFNFHIFRDQKGLKATYDNPDVAFFNSPVNEITLEGDTVFFRINNINTTYKGHVNGDFTKISGEGSLYGHNRRIEFGRKKIMKIIPVNEDCMTVGQATVRVIKTNPHGKLPYTGIRVVKAGIPKTIEIDSSQLKVVTPGKDSYSNPVVYTIPEKMEVGQYNIHQSNSQIDYYILKAKQPE